MSTYAVHIELWVEANPKDEDPFEEVAQAVTDTLASGLDWQDISSIALVDPKDAHVVWEWLQ